MAFTSPKLHRRRQPCPAAVQNCHRAASPPETCWSIAKLLQTITHVFQMAVFLALNAIEFGLWRDRSQAPGPAARRRSLPQGQIETAFKVLWRDGRIARHDRAQGAEGEG